MTWKIERIKEPLQEDSNRTLEDIGYGNESSLTTTAGHGPMLICLNMSAPNVLIDTFYARLHNLN